MLRFLATPLRVSQPRLLLPRVQSSVVSSWFTRAQSSAAAAPAESALDAVSDSVQQPAPPLRYTSDMRPPGDTSRKWVKVDEQGRAYATGRRKTAVARVWVWETPDDQLAAVRINKQSLSRFFGGHWMQRHTVLAPFFETGTTGKYSVTATVRGGGINGQAEAVRHGIATALQGLDALLRPTLKRAGFMKRDPRRRERKKPGQTGARRKFQWVKR